MKRMKPIPYSPPIAFIMPSLADMSPSGVTTFVRQMTEGFGKYGNRFRVVEIPHGNYEPTMSEAPCGAGIPAGVGVKSEAGNILARRPVALFLALGYLKLIWIDVRRVWAVRGQCRHSIILTNQFGCETLPIALRLVFPFARIVAISHTHPGQGSESDHWVRRWVERICYYSLSDVLFNSNASRQQWGQKLKVKRGIGQVVHLGTEPPDIEVPLDYPYKKAGTIDFICIARFVHWKGQMNLVRAWALLKEKLLSSCRIGELLRGVGQVRLIFVGDGECFEEVRDEAIRLGLEDRVIFLGHRPRADIYLNGADVAILASTESEAFGLVLLEAMSRGMPVAASKLGGIPEVVEDEESGLLFDPYNLDSIIDVVTRLAGSKTERVRLGENGRKRWGHQFTIEHMVARYGVSLGFSGSEESF
jgi:glycosyltransferase involved in cell wall biosynthesis